MRKVIIGAGPSGLYAAIKLRKSGIRDVVVYDPREGNYTRPGHLNQNVFTRAQQGLDLDFWPKGERGHISDLEQSLYKEAKKLGIKIENKRFVRLHDDATKPGVVVAGTDGQEEIVEADYVFDCTGTRRAVVTAVNERIPDSPLQLDKITDLPVRNHFLAYVTIAKSDWLRFEMESELVKEFPDTVSALSFAQSIVKLRALGWKEFKFPRCYGMEFGEDKVCLYLHAPENLTAENYDKWVQTVLECYTKQISYKHLSASPKTYFLPFPASAQALKEVSHKGKNLPTVVALGDAQIDFDYSLAHGIYDGMERIDALFHHAVMFDNEIYYFDSAEYWQTINIMLREHKEAVIKEAEKVKQSFVTALDISQLKFRQALMLSNDSGEQKVISEFLKEIEERQSYEKARKAFSEIHTASYQVVLTRDSIESVIAKLNAIQTDLLKAHAGLPELFAAERQEAQDRLVDLAASWKVIGNTLFKKQKLSQAIEAYKNALEIYNHNNFVGKHVLKELPIYSNMAIVYLQGKQYSEAITAAETALLIYDGSSLEEQPASLQDKIVFNLIKGLCAKAQEFIQSSKTKDAKELHRQAIKVINTHQDKLTSQTLKSVTTIIEELQQRLLSKIDSSDGVSLVHSSGALDAGLETETTQNAIRPQERRTQTSNGPTVGQSLGDLGFFSNNGSQLPTDSVAKKVEHKNPQNCIFM